MARWIPFLVVVWVAATLFERGDLGKYSDDWFFSRHDPVSGAAVGSTSLSLHPFSRPLHGLVLNEVARTLWLHDAAYHLMNAIAHAVVAGLLATLVLLLGGPPLAAAGATALLVAYPAHFEVVFWPAALPAALACAVFLVVCIATIAHARRDAAQRSWTVRGLLVAIAVLSFVIPCLYEQPAAGLLALPLLHRAALPSDAASRRHALPVVLAAWAGAAAYLVPYWATVPPEWRGNLATLPTPGALAADAVRLAREVAAHVAMLGFVRGATTSGLEALLAAPARAVVLAVLAAATTWLAVTAQPGRASSRRLRALPVAAFGCAVFLACWLPVLAEPGTPTSSRLLYAPSIGLAVVLAAALDCVSRMADAARPRAARSAARVLAAAALVAAIAMIGVQAAYRARTHADTALGVALVRALPDPPPGTLLLVLSDERQPVATGSPAFDGALTSVLVLPQAATPWVRWAYRRNDLFAAQPTPWGIRVADVMDDGVRVVGLEPAFPIPHPSDPRGGVRVPWSRLAVLRVDRAGTVRVERPEALRIEPR